MWSAFGSRRKFPDCGIMQSAVVSPRQSFREFEFPRARDSIPMIGRHRRAADLRTTGSKTLLEGERDQEGIGETVWNSNGLIFVVQLASPSLPSRRQICPRKKNVVPRDRCYFSFRSKLDFIERMQRLRSIFLILWLLDDKILPFLLFLFIIRFAIFPGFFYDSYADANLGSRMPRVMFFMLKCHPIAHDSCAIIVKSTLQQHEC